MVKLPDGKVLETMSAFQIAELLGVSYIGDCNVLDYDGTFYETRNWAEYGYASAVRFYRVSDDEDRLYVEYCTISKSESQLADALKFCGWVHTRPGFVTQEGSGEDVGVTPELEIEAFLACWGADTVADFTGPYVRKFRPNKNGSLREWRVWDEVKGWLENLSE